MFCSALSALVSTLQSHHRRLENQWKQVRDSLDSPSSGSSRPRDFLKAVKAGNRRRKIYLMLGGKPPSLPWEPNTLRSSISRTLSETKTFFYICTHSIIIWIDKAHCYKSKYTLYSIPTTYIYTYTYSLQYTIHEDDNNNKVGIWRTGFINYY